MWQLFSALKVVACYRSFDFVVSFRFSCRQPVIFGSMILRNIWNVIKQISAWIFVFSLSWLGDVIQLHKSDELSYFPLLKVMCHGACLLAYFCWADFFTSLIGQKNICNLYKTFYVTNLFLFLWSHSLVLERQALLYGIQAKLCTEYAILKIATPWHCSWWVHTASVLTPSLGSRAALSAVIFFNFVVEFSLWIFGFIQENLRMRSLILT